MIGKLFYLTFDVVKLPQKLPTYVSVTGLLGLFLLSVVACRDTDKNKLAEVDGAVITAREVDVALGPPLSQLNRQIYTLRRQKLDEQIDSLLLESEARRRGMPVKTLLEQEVDKKIMPVSDTEITALYEANKSRIPVELDKVRDKIREFLRGQKVSAQRALFLKSLREKAKIVTYLTPPPVFRVEVSVTGEPSKGPINAPVTIVKFEDFQCPFCKRVQPTFEELFKRYKGEIRLVHKDFPLDSLHSEARQAAEAARCASDQGKFWEYHDKTYENAPKAAINDLKGYAKDVGLNMTVFEQCLNSGKFKVAVQKNLLEGTKLGITGTPAFFINGRELSGAQPLEQFTRIIDEELARAGKS